MSEIICECGHEVSIHSVEGCHTKLSGSGYYCPCERSNVGIYERAINRMTAEHDAMQVKLDKLECLNRISEEVGDEDNSKINALKAQLDMVKVALNNLFLRCIDLYNNKEIDELADLEEARVALQEPKK